MFWNKLITVQSFPLNENCKSVISPTNLESQYNYIISFAILYNDAYMWLKHKPFLYGGIPTDNYKYQIILFT